MKMAFKCVSSRRFSQIVSLLRMAQWWWKAVRQMVIAWLDQLYGKECCARGCNTGDWLQLQSILGPFLVRALCGNTLFMLPYLHCSFLPSLNVWASVWFDVYFRRLSVNNANNRPYMIMSCKEKNGPKWKLPFKRLYSSSSNPCVHFFCTTTTLAVQPQT